MAAMGGLRARAHARHGVLGRPRPAVEREDAGQAPAPTCLLQTSFRTLFTSRDALLRRLLEGGNLHPARRRLAATRPRAPVARPLRRLTSLRLFDAGARGASETRRRCSWRGVRRPVPRPSRPVTAPPRANSSHARAPPRPPPGRAQETRPADGISPIAPAAG